MRKLWLGAILFAVAAGLAVTHASTLGLDIVWPFVVGLAFAPLGARGKGLIRTSLSVVLGVGLSVGVFVAVTEWMPWIPVSFGIMVGIAIAVMGTAAALAPKQFALPPMLVAFAVFYGAYQDHWAANRGAFRTEAFGDAAAVIVAMLGGLLVSFVVSSVLHVQARQREGEVIPFRSRLRTADDAGDRRVAAGGM